MALTKEEELVLGGVIQNYLKAKEEGTDTVEMKNDYDTAVLKLCKQYENAAYQVAHKVFSSTYLNYSREDMFQDMKYALLKAIRSYDPSKNCKLSTHAFYVLRKSAQQKILEVKTCIKTPPSVADRIDTIKASEYKFQQLVEAGCPSVQNVKQNDFVSKDTGLKQWKIREAQNTVSAHSSLNMPVGEGGTELIEVIQQGELERFKREQKAKDDVESKLSKHLAKLTKKELEILKYEYPISKNVKPYATFLQENELTEANFQSQLRAIVRKLKNYAKDHERRLNVV